jgi:hypothetical protein
MILYRCWCCNFASWVWFMAFNIWQSIKNHFSNMKVSKIFNRCWNLSLFVNQLFELSGIGFQIQKLTSCSFCFKNYTEVTREKFKEHEIIRIKHQILKFPWIYYTWSNVWQITASNPQIPVILHLKQCIVNHSKVYCFNFI